MDEDDWRQKGERERGLDPGLMSLQEDLVSVLGVTGAEEENPHLLLRLSLGHETDCFTK